MTELFSMTKETVIALISELCESEHLAYDNILPVPVSPGIWQFHAVEMDDKCAKHGYCRQMRYYAREVDGQMVLC